MTPPLSFFLKKKIQLQHIKPQYKRTIFLNYLILIFKIVSKSVEFELCNKKLKILRADARSDDELSADK